MRIALLMVLVALTSCSAEMRKRFAEGAASHVAQSQASQRVWESQPQTVIPDWQGDNATEMGIPVYKESECIGPVIMGRCHGAILPEPGYRPKCYGTWSNGSCIGPMF